jgi:hypothetical protein
MGRKRNNIKGLDRFHYHEVQDRAHMIGNLITEYLTEHPVVMKHQELRDRVKIAEDNIFEVYQLMASIDEEVFPEDYKESDKQ